MSISYLTYPQIDKQKWDECINHSQNRLIYAKSFYLDAMAKHWDGLVLNNYEAVMPLTWKKKWGIRYLYQPAFIQQGGIFFSEPLSESIQQSFIDRAFSHFRFAEITLNFLNKTIDPFNSLAGVRNNFILALNKSYTEIYSGYDTVAVKNLKRAKNAGLQYSVIHEFLPVLKLYESLYAERLPYFSKPDFTNFGIICKKLFGENNLVVRNVSGDKNELLAAAILLKDNNRLYNLISCVSPEGKLAQANYFLYDQLIQEFCDSQYLLDFEGSDVKGIADFYNRFSPQNEPYPFIKMNHLPPILKLFKR